MLNAARALIADREKFRMNFVRSRCDGRAVKSLMQEDAFSLRVRNELLAAAITSPQPTPAILCSERPTPQNLISLICFCEAVNASLATKIILRFQSPLLVVSCALKPPGRRRYRVHVGERRFKFHFWEHYCVFAYQADHSTRRWHYRLRRAPYLVVL
jgi:hypothetical protein